MKASELNIGDVIYRAYISEYTLTSEVRQYQVVAKFDNATDRCIILKHMSEGRCQEYSDKSVYNTKLFAYNIDRANELALEELASRVIETEEHLSLQKEALKKFSELFAKEKSRKNS